MLEPHYHLNLAIRDEDWKKGGKSITMLSIAQILQTGEGPNWNDWSAFWSVPQIQKTALYLYIFFNEHFFIYIAIFNSYDL